MNLRALLTSDRAENSIMQTISIAVSSVLIAAGLVTAPSLINNARDGNAKLDLANVSYAQDFVQSDTGQYRDRVDDLLASEHHKLTLSLPKDNLSIWSNDAKDCYTAFAKSMSGKTYYTTSSTARIDPVPSPWPTSAPSAVPAGCSWPLSAGTATATSIQNLVMNPFGPSGWNAGSAGTGGTAANTYEATGGPNGLGYFKSTLTTKPTAGSIDKTMSLASTPDTKVGQEYTGSLWVKASIVSNWTLRIDWYERASSTWISKSTGSSVTVQPNTWTRISVTGVMPDGAQTGRIAMASAVPGTWRNAEVGANWGATGAMLTEGSTLHSYADGNTPGWSWSGAPGSSVSSGLPYTLESLVGAPDQQTFGPATLPGPATVDPFSDRTLYMVTTATDIQSGSQRIARLGSTDANHGRVLVSRNNGSYGVNYYREGDTANTRLEGSVSLSSTAVGPHLVSVTLSNSASSISIAVDGGAPNTKSFADGGMGGLSFPVMYIYDGTGPDTQGYAVLLPGGYNTAVSKWIANEYGLALSA